MSPPTSDWWLLYREPPQMEIGFPMPVTIYDLNELRRAVKELNTKLDIVLNEIELIDFVEKKMREAGDNTPELKTGRSTKKTTRSRK